MTDVVVRGGRVVVPDGPAEVDVAITDGVITELGPELPGCRAREEIDARGLWVLPGAVDAHVHLNDPGRADWEGFPTGTAALAAGGTTTCVDMPLNSSPPTIDPSALAAKVAAATGRVRVDVAFWGGLVPGNQEHLPALAAAGVVGFKAFMSRSGIDDFAPADELTLFEGMASAAELGLPVAVHAESRAITDALAARSIAAGETSTRAYLDSRPAIAELTAIRLALTLASETGCALHIVHVSTGRAVREIALARGTGVDVSCETCPHYLVLDDDDAEELGALAKCAPPLRPRADRDDLWKELLSGHVTTVGSDHSPTLPELKRGDDMFRIWGGIAGGQLMLALMWHAGVHANRTTVEVICELLSTAPAQRFGLAGKGAIAPGADADLLLVDPNGGWVVDRTSLHDRHRLNPYLGRTLHGRVVRTILRGRTIAVDGAPVGDPIGTVVTRCGA